VSASYPGSDDAFTFKPISVDAVNDLQDAIVDIETELGATLGGADATIAVTHGRVPTSGQNDALPDTKGSPGTTNRDVTETRGAVKSHSMKLMDYFLMGAKDAG